MIERMEHLEQFIRAHERVLGNFLFYVSLFIYIFLQVMAVSFVVADADASKILMLLNICMAMLLFKEVLIHQLDWKSLLGLLVLLIVSELYWHANNRWAIMTLVYIYSARTVSFKKSSWVYIASTLLAMSLVIVLALTGVIPNYLLNIAGRHRWTLGFTYTLVPASLFIGVTMLWICARKKRITWWELAGLLFFNIVLFWATRSRVPILIAVLAICLGIFLKLRPNAFANHRKLRLAAVPSFAVLALASLAATIGYMKNAAWAVALNSHMDHRIMLAAKAFKKVGFRLLGYDYTMIGNGLNLDGVSAAEEFGKYTYIDNMYMQFLMKEGIIFFVLIIILTTWLFYKLTDWEKQGYLLGMLFLLSVQSILQDVYLNIYYNLFLLLYGIVLLAPKTEVSESASELAAVPEERPKMVPVDDRYII